MCFGCSKEPSHRDASFEYPEHMFRLSNKKINDALLSRVLKPQSYRELNKAVTM